MGYALADILLFLVLLAALWIGLYRLYLWIVQRRQRSESQQLIQMLESDLNKSKKNRKEDSDA